MFSQQLLLKVESGCSALKMQGWWKGKFALFQEWKYGGSRWTVVQKIITSNHASHDNQWSRRFIDERRGFHAETAQSSLTVFLKIVM